VRQVDDKAGESAGRLFARQVNRGRSIAGRLFAGWSFVESSIVGFEYFKNIFHFACSLY